MWILLSGCFGHYAGSSLPRKQDALITETQICPDQSQREGQWQSSNPGSV